jgi:hypothetical protein
MTQDERPFADTLTLPLRDDLCEDSRHDHWLKLADIALAAAREEQARIKEQIRPHVERYKQLRGQSPSQKPLAKNSLGRRRRPSRTSGSGRART